MKTLLHIAGDDSVLTVTQHPTGSIIIDLGVNKGANPPMVSTETVYGATLVRMVWEDENVVPVTEDDPCPSRPPPDA
jgi:hypothetical protein